jgi:large subunit ribosomal protein L10
MNREEKNAMIEELVQELNENPNFYLTDTSSLTVEKTNNLRRACFNKHIKMRVVKNSLLQKAMEKTGRNYSELFPALAGTTAVMFTASGSEPAKLIKQFRKDNPKGGDRPVLKAAFVEESTYLGDNQLDTLASIKSKNELIGDIIGLLQSPAKNVVSALQSGKNKLAGIVKTLSEKPE